MCNAFYRRVQKSNFNNTKFAIFGDKYLSQDLIVILRNITQLCQVRQRGVGEGVNHSASPPSTDCLHLMSAGLRSQLISKLESLRQC